MRARPVIQALLVAFALASVAASAPESAEVELKLQQMDLDNLLRVLELLTGRSVLRPAQMPAISVTFSADNLLTRSEAVGAIETLLAMNQIGVSPYGDKFLLASPISQIKTQTPAMITGSTLDLLPSGMIATKLFTLQTLRLADFVPQLQSILSGGIGGSFVLFEKANAALVTDSISNLQRVERLLEAIDHPAEPKVYALRYARASDLVTEIKAALAGGAAPEQAATANITADARANQLVVVCDPKIQPFFDGLVRQLDTETAGSGRYEVFYLKHANVKDVLPVLLGMVGGAAGTPGTPAPKTPPAGGSGLSIQAEDRSNAVIVRGSETELRQIQGLIDKIDVALAQVRIEVVIAEVSLGDNVASGISALGLNVQGDRLVGFQGAAAGATVAGAGGSSFATVTRPDLAGEIQLMTTPRKDSTTILSVPSITTTHNKEATVFVGETRPMITSSQTVPISGAATGFATSSAISQQDIGISLKVKPLVGADGSVQLDIQQEVAEEGASVLIDNNQEPIILKRSTSSFISAQSGDIIVLGGLQTQTRTKSTSRLGPIPLIGDLLGGRSKSTSRTELIFFVRPIVLTGSTVDNAAALRAVDAMPHADDVKRALR